MTTAEHVVRLGRFVRVMHKPHYVLYGVLWVCAVEGAAALLSDRHGQWHPGWHTAVRAGVVSIVLLYLRMVDEQKDLDYDSVNNPDRPLVTGAVSAGELQAGMAAITVVSLAASLALSWSSALLVALTVVYGLALWGFEALSETLRRDVLANLVVTYPVQLWLTAYVVVSAQATGEAQWSWSLLAIVPIFAGAFLQFEFARKTQRTKDVRQALYSNPLGSTGSALATCAFALAAVTVDLAVVQPWTYDGVRAVVTWIPLLLALIPVYGTVRYLGGTRSTYPIAPAVIFVLTFYPVLIVQALVGSA